MSTLSVNTITDANGGNTAKINNMTPTADSLQGFRNRIINGDMRIDQRNAGASVTIGSSTYPIDRWEAAEGVNPGGMTGQQVSDVPPGFVNSLNITVTAAGTAGASQNIYLRQFIEGFNVSDFNWGTANAKTVTLSFWVKSSLTGAFSGAVSNVDSNRSYVFTYTINSANTWEQKSVTIAGDTTGTWNTTNGRGIALWFDLGSGSNITGSSGAWDASLKIKSTGSVSLIGTLNATWYITGVQLEAGGTATPFERRPYGTELALCQRYYYKAQPDSSGSDYAVGNNASTTESRVMVFFPVSMRIAPTALEQSGTAADYTVRHAATFTACSSVPAFFSATKNTATTQLTVASGLTAGQGSFLRPANTSAYLAWSAEL